MGKREEKRQLDALNNWINISGDTQDVYKRYGGDFFFLLTFIQRRIMEEGTDKYVNMSDADIDKICRDLKAKNEEISNKVEPDGSRHIPIWQDYNERDLITMIKAFVQLSSEDKHEVLGIKSLWG